jgi:hypothetical protein
MHRRRWIPFQQGAGLADESPSPGPLLAPAFVTFPRAFRNIAATARGTGWTRRSALSSLEGQAA